MPDSDALNALIQGMAIDKPLENLNLGQLGHGERGLVNELSLAFVAKPYDNTNLPACSCFDISGVDDFQTMLCRPSCSDTVC